jgi:hypothetical protein
MFDDIGAVKKILRIWQLGIEHVRIRQRALAIGNCSFPLPIICIASGGKTRGMGHLSRHNLMNGFKVKGKRTDDYTHACFCINF